ncbi:unnamed protein product [Porites evermanni]|uniref:Uncharacterized protein n=1 Tax=Porites evermanni TaxID=104178 RepID=A0ABN8M1N0_9CNID|nr:unnamed protein product [Porites evermanni]
MNSDRVRKDCFKVGNAFMFNAAREMAKSEESAEKQLQLMNTEVHSINAPKGYQGLKNERQHPNSDSGLSPQRRMPHAIIIDFGAETNIVPSSLYNQLGPRVMNLQKPTMKPTAYGGTEIPNLGSC